MPAQHQLKQKFVLLAFSLAAFVGYIYFTRGLNLTLTVFLGFFTVLSGGVFLKAAHNQQKMVSENIRLMQAVDAASDGVLITDPNRPDNPIVYVNSTFSKITGYASQEILGKNCRFLQGPETAPETVEQIRRAIQERQHIKVTILNYRKNGTAFWNGLRISPVFSQAGKLQYFLGFQADVTERMKAEMQLIAERDYTAAIIRGTPAVVCGIGADGRTTFINPAGEKATGYKAQELIGKDFWETFFAGEEYKQVKGLFESFNRGDVRDYEMTLTAKSGEKRTISWNTLNRYDPSGRKLVEIIGFGDDVTERKKLVAQLEQSQKMETVGTLAGGIAHDLNNQLTPLAGYLDLALKDTPEADPRRELLQEAEQATRRCAEVVQRLMNVSRPSNQKKSWLKLSNLLTETKKLFAKTLPSTIRTEVIYDDPLWPVLGNETELQTVLMNMAVNARDAMPNGGRLMIQASNSALDESRVRPGFKTGNYVLISVTDTGQGIVPENLNKIFEPFFTTKLKGQGTGLGLAMVFRIVKDHGGWVEASSEPGKGTMMQIYLPADPKARSEQRGIDGTGQNMPRGNNETVLFVDDEETLRSLGRVFLERLGYKALLAQDGEEAVNLYRSRHSEIAAVVLDMTMPKLSGRQVLKKMLEIDPRAKVLLASGFTAEGTAKELIQEGAADFLAKPYTISPLAQMLKKVLEK